MNPMPFDLTQAMKLYAEKYLEAGLEQELSRARRYKRDLALILLVPRPPQVLLEEEKAHVIQELTEMARRITRNVDTGLALPFGVLLVLPETPEEGARIVGDKIRRETQARTFEGSGGSFMLKLTVAMAHYPKDGESRQELLDALKEQITAK